MALVVGFFVVFFIVGVPQAVIGGVAPCGDNEPYIDLVAEDPLAGGTVAVTSAAIVNGEFIGTATSGSSGEKYVLGDDVTLLVGAANYINKTVDVNIGNCGANRVNTDIFGSDAGTLDVLDDTFTKVVDSAAGTGVNNITSAAGSITFKVSLRGTSDQSTGDLLVTIEVNDTQVDDFSVSGCDVIDSNFVEAESYDLFVTEGTAPRQKLAFVVSELVNAEVATCDVTLNPETGKTIGDGTRTSAVYVNVHSAQACVDSDNTFRERCWEDQRGTSKVEDSWTDHDALIE